MFFILTLILEKKIYTSKCVGVYKLVSGNFTVIVVINVTELT